MLWVIFSGRVEPMVRISFTWSLEQLRSASMDTELRTQFTDAEHGFVFSIFLISIVSLSDEDCNKMPHGSRHILLSEFQNLCKEALARTNLFCITDIMVLRALTMYMVIRFCIKLRNQQMQVQMAGVDRLNTHSMWSLMGFTVRNAEKLGIHRDGTILGLPPAETELRRRLWWQLQHLDLFPAARCGLTSSTLMLD